MSAYLQLFKLLENVILELEFQQNIGQVFNQSNGVKFITLSAPKNFSSLSWKHKSIFLVKLFLVKRPLKSSQFTNNTQSR